MATTAERSFGRSDVYATAAAADGTIERSVSAVSWASIIGGAVTAAAVTLVLLELGTGLGLSMVSPWPYSGVSPTTFSIAAGLWLIVVQWIAAGIGGYIAGRLRTKWVGLHTDEVFFRDTAHGFLSWALATVISALFIVSVALAAIGGTASAVTQIASGAVQGASQGAIQRGGNSFDPMAYFTDTLFRADASAAPAEQSSRDSRPEAGRILATDLRNGDLTQDDRAYLAQLVAARTGLSQGDAEKRIDDVVTQIKATETQAKEAADAARKAAASAAIITALAMLIGAFIACAAGALGGRLRDEY